MPHTLNILIVTLLQSYNVTFRKKCKAQIPMSTPRIITTERWNSSKNRHIFFMDIAKGSNDFDPRVLLFADGGLVEITRLNSSLLNSV